MHFGADLQQTRTALAPTAICHLCHHWDARITIYFILWTWLFLRAKLCKICTSRWPWLCERKFAHLRLSFGVIRKLKTSDFLSLVFWAKNDASRTVNFAPFFTCSSVETSNRCFSLPTSWINRIQVHRRASTHEANLCLDKSQEIMGSAHSREGNIAAQP